MRVLLTGASGFLGANCLRHLLDHTDWDIVCPASFHHRGAPERITFTVRPDEWARVTVVTCDLSAPIADTTAALFGDVDYVINFASESHVDRSITKPVPFIQNNVNLVLNLLEYAREAKPKAFVQISTDEVYGSAPLGREHVEWDTVLPSSPYSASKAAQEAIAISYWRTYGVPLVLVNCMNLFGEMQDPEKFVPTIIRGILRGEPVPVHVSSTGVIGSRFYLHARNLADAVLFLLRRDRPVMLHDGAERPDRWHVVGERELDNLEMAQLVAKLLDRELNYRLVDFNIARPGHDPRYALNGAKLAAAGWTPPSGFDDSLRSLIAWSLANPLWVNRVAQP